MLGLIAIAVVAAPESFSYLGIKLSGSTSCSVTRVIDGDTLHAYCPGRGFLKARLLGYDTPEIYSPKCIGEWWAGTKATWALRRLLWNASETKLVLSGTDRYQRRLGTLFVDGRNVSRIMIDAGDARAYSGGKRAGWC